MTRYQTPGVYFEWLNTRQDGLLLQRTDITGFVGICQRGPLHTPQKIESWPQFTSIFGGCIPQAYLAYAVQGFFANGGRTCWVVRAADPETAFFAYANLRDEKGKIALSLQASSAGTWAHQMEAAVLRSADTRFSLTLRLPDGSQELWRDLTLELAPKVLNDPDTGSRLVEAFRVNAAPQTAAPQNDGPGLTLKEGRYYFKNGQDGLAKLSPAHLTGVGAPEGQLWGLELLEDIPEISILAMPDVMTKEESGGKTYTPPPRCDVVLDQPADVPAQAGDSTPPETTCRAAPLDEIEGEGQAAAQAQADAEDRAEAERKAREAQGDLILAEPVAPLEYPPAFGDDQIYEMQWRMVLQCETHKNRVAVLDLPKPVMMPNEAIAWARKFDTTYAAVYYPWLRVPDANDLPGALRSIPPSGHVAGVYARVDFVFGVQKPPANELLALTQDLSMPVTDVVHGLLNDAQVNALRVYPGRGLRVAGERTLASDPAWRYVNVRRLLIMIERSIDVGTQWITFEPNNFRMWRDTERVITSFLDMIWRRGMLDGAKAEDAYQVRCDESTNPPEETDQGRLLCLVGVLPPAPAEFVIARIGRTESGSLVLEG